ncbi:MAG: hypothetical protein DLD55_00800 [candidate division SR1 bacterium]|nr:MAG: hypothetical protein DLD55_00800 [candidate division SR1 bacterium]
MLKKRKRGAFLRAIWLLRLATLIARQDQLSRAKLEPFLWLLFTILLFIGFLESKLPSKKLKRFGYFLVAIYYLFLALFFTWVFLMVPWDYFELWSLGLMIIFLIVYLGDGMVRRNIIHFCSQKKE